MILPYLSADEIRGLSDTGLSAIIRLAEELEQALKWADQFSMALKVERYRDDLEIERFAREQKAA